MIENDVVGGLASLVNAKKLTIEAYLRQCAYLGVSISAALVAIGVTAPAQASTDTALDTLERVVPASAALEIRQLGETATTGAETDLAQWYDWGDWVDWGDWGDWYNWDDWGDWGDWYDWVDWGDWGDWGDWWN